MFIILIIECYIKVVSATPFSNYESWIGVSALNNATVRCAVQSSREIELATIAVVITTL
jgi:hypothetical protein